MTTTPTSDARWRPLHSKSKSKIIEQELEIRGRPPPRGGARASLVDHRLNRRAKIENQTAKNFPPPLHRPLSIKSPSSCSASHLKSRPSEDQSEYVSPKALCKQSSLHLELPLKHCMAKIFTMRLQNSLRNEAILIQQQIQLRNIIASQQRHQPAVTQCQCRSEINDQSRSHTSENLIETISLAEK